MTGLEGQDALRASQDSLGGGGGDTTPRRRTNNHNLKSSQNLKRSASLHKSGDILISQDDLQVSENGTDGSSNPAATQPSDDVTPTTPKSRGSARYSTFFSSTSYTNINYYEEFCALFPHFAIVPTEGFRVELGGRVSGDDQEVFLQDQDAHNLPYHKIFQKNGTFYNFICDDWLSNNL